MIFYFGVLGGLDLINSAAADTESTGTIIWSRRYRNEIIVFVPNNGPYYNASNMCIVCIVSLRVMWKNHDPYASETLAKTHTVFKTTFVPRHAMKNRAVIYLLRGSRRGFPVDSEMISLIIGEHCETCIIILCSCTGCFVNRTHHVIVFPRR